MLLQEEKDGDYTKPSWLGSGDERIPPNRRRWNTVLGNYPYPGWSDHDRVGYIQPLGTRSCNSPGRCSSTRSTASSKRRSTPTRWSTSCATRSASGPASTFWISKGRNPNTGDGPRAACAIMLNPIYGKKQQKRKQAEVDRALDEGLTFVKHIRGRITRYVEFGDEDAAVSRGAEEGPSASWPSSSTR